MFVELTLLAYMIDMFFGEFRYIKHPVVFMGDYINLFQKYLYKDSIFRGFLLTLSLLIITLFMVNITLMITPIFGEFEIFVLAILASMGIASNMLYSSVLEVVSAEDKREKISMLVSRDTKEMSESDVNKAAIETYAENLSDGVIAPLFYLFLFGLEGLFIYKTINTLDSMVGYKNEKYEKFGKFSARLDDVANLIPSRFSAMLIAALFFSKNTFLNLWRYARLHESPNAGYPISAMALSLGVKLGGATSYFGVIKDKPYFGSGRGEITAKDVLKALSLKRRVDLFVIVSLISVWVLSWA